MARLLTVKEATATEGVPRWTVRRIIHGLDWRARRLIAQMRARMRQLTPSGSSFERAVLARYKVAAADEVIDPTVRVWIDFTLSSVERGRWAVSLMGGPSAFRGKRVLDVGCAYGGFLVAASEAGAKETNGIDVNQGLLDLARMQLDDYEVEGNLAVADVTSPQIVDHFGRYDIILCNDVAEHVLDPLALARNLAKLLVKGGTVFLQIPNGQAIDYMRRDGHYGLFGITLLDREKAERWWRLHFPEEVYGVEHYASLAYYVDIFSKQRIFLRLLDAFPEGDEMEAVIDSLEERFEAFRGEVAELQHDDPNSVDLVAAIRSRGAEEIDEFGRLLGRYRATDNRSEKAILASTLYGRYGLTAWQFKGTKL